MKNIRIFFIVLLMLFNLSCKDASRKSRLPWIDLFNGRDLTGWIQRGGSAIYEITDNAIVGTSVSNTPNSFLCTEDMYGDFILELEFKVDSSLNSGIQIRSHSLPGYQNGRVHGYQVEIDPSERAWTGGIYDEARRGWLYALADPGLEEARLAFKKEEWNKFRVEAIDSSIKTWVNGIPAANLFDDETAEGFIALQVHSIRDSSLAGTRVMWRNLRIITESPERYATETSAPEKAYLTNMLTEKEKAAGWKLLFDGQTSSGWRRASHETFPESGWTIENGILTLQADNRASGRQGGHIVTTERYANFELVLQARLTPRANSGIKYFVTDPEHIGAEFQILDDRLHPNANKPDCRFGSLYDVMEPQNVRANPVGQWNNIRIVVDGKHVEHWLNGFKLLEYDRGSTEFKERVAESKFRDMPGYARPESGHIQLQDHGDEVSFRSIKIRTW
jgi:hypothetical protein